MHRKDSMWTLALAFALATAAWGAPCAAAPQPPSEAQQTVAEYLDLLIDMHVFDVYEGQNPALKAATADVRPLQVAAGFPVDMDSAALFTQGFTDGAWSVYETGIVSLDAQALRLRVELSALTPGEELWLLEPAGPRAFGPYTA
ncbi:MAG TPA: hypothetical protein ENN80_05785, partial [Candidatus Hydrogenedentes bacterium]|nr:hypothetical protein [Candidatus Hydrogenedentota bacterium]